MKYLSVLVVLLLVSCEPKDLSDADLFVLINNANMNYKQSRDTMILSPVYDTLKYNKEFREKGLTANNYFTVYPLLLNLKKYDELDSLLSKKVGIPKYTQFYALNMARFYKNRKQDPAKAKAYITKNLNKVQDSISRSPKDSLLYVDYFTMRMLLNGKYQALKEIDSMQAVNHTYTDVFYNTALKSAVQNYSDK